MQQKLWNYLPLSDVSLNTILLNTSVRNYNNANLLMNNYYIKEAGLRTYELSSLIYIHRMFLLGVQISIILPFKMFITKLTF